MQIFRPLVFLLVITSTLSSKAADSLLTQSRFSTITIKQYQAFWASNAAGGSRTIEPIPISASINIPQELQPFIDSEDIQAVCDEVFEKEESSFTKQLSKTSQKILFWKEPHTGKKYYAQEDWGLLRNQNASVWKKVGRGEVIIGGTELLCMGVLMMMPKEVTKWSDNWMADAGKHLKRAFTEAPVMDKDDWMLNYVGHPIAGALYYNTLRSQNATWFQSFLFSTAQSFIWEYLIEGIAEQPSAQDLVITPVAGAILGEACHLLTMGMRKNGFNFAEKMATLVLNPMFVINNGFGPKHNPVRQ